MYIFGAAAPPRTQSIRCGVSVFGIEQRLQLRRGEDILRVAELAVHLRVLAVYDDDSLDASDVREIQRELGVRIDDNVIVACDVTYQNGQDNDFYFEFVQVDGQWYLLFVVE